MSAEGLAGLADALTEALATLDELRDRLDEARDEARDWLDKGASSGALRQYWPAVAEALSRPWADDAVRLDMVYWAGEAKRRDEGKSHALPKKRGAGFGMSTRAYAKRWGWSHWRARQMTGANDDQ